MQLQLRTYTINKGALEQWVSEWRAQLVPLREKLGFRVLEAYTVPSTNQFVWLMGYDGPDSWEVADQAYFDSPMRKTMQPDPGRLIARMENHFVTRVM
jgi:NIPSNAP